MTKGDVNRNIVAALSYFLGFVTGLVILFVEKDDKFVRFHAMQSVVVSAGFFVLNILVGIVFNNLAFLGFLATIVNALLSIAALVFWIVSMIKAYQGELFKWPIAGDFAERWVSKG